jgi:putative glycosyltransferase (TIGR04372 family)
MRTLGWWQGDLLILARADIIANKPCLSLFDKFAKIIVKDHDVSSPVWDELCSLQRWLGLNFNACSLPDGQIANWPDASAFVARQWAQQWPDQFPLKKEYEVRFANDPRVVSVFDEALRSWGMNKADWFVCLHMRDANFYAEHQSAGQTHRNSDFDPYRQAIEYIISLGGWVIRMGSASARPLPQMRGLIDYARSPFKCAILDLHLLYSSRFFIGTTSGLGNIANSFGVPMALVNCITVDGQLWHNRVRFVLKQVLRRDGPPLSQREFTNDCRWRLFAQEPLRQDGLIPCDSSTDEIFEIVKEVEEISKTGATEPKSDEERALLERWRNSLAIPYFYGASQPSRYYLKKYRETFFQYGSSESN